MPPRALSYERRAHFAKKAGWFQFCSVAEIAEVCEVKWRMSIDISATFRLLSCIHIHIFCFTLQSRTLEESLANAKVGAGQQCMYEGPPNEEIYGKWTARNTMLKNTFSCLQRCRWQYCSSFVQLLLHPKSAEFYENLNLYSSRSSKVIDLGVNRKRMCNFLLVINSNFGRISYSFRDIDAFSFKIACFLTTVV